MGRNVIVMIHVKPFNNKFLHSCTYCIYDDLLQEGYVIDIGDVEPIISFAQSLRIRIKGLFLTHAHFDHVYGLNEFALALTSVRIYCSKETLCGLKDERSTLSHLYMEETFVVPSDERFVVVSEKTEDSWLNQKCTFLSTPGHDPGCMCLLIGNNIFTGDSYIPDHPVVYLWPHSKKEEAILNEKRIKDIITNNGLKVYPGHNQ